MESASEQEREGRRRSMAEEGRAEGRPLSVKWMKRGKTKRQTAKDGIRSNQGISRYMYIYIHALLFSLTNSLRFSSSISSLAILSLPLSSCFLSLFLSSFLLIEEFIKRRFG